MAELHLGGDIRGQAEKESKEACGAEAGGRGGPKQRETGGKPGIEQPLLCVPIPKGHWI